MTCLLRPIRLLVAIKLVALYNRFASLGTDSVGDLSKLQAVANTVAEFLPVGKGNAIDYEMVVKPLLSRVKCVCLQNLNKKIGVLYKKSDADTFRQSVQKVFSFFASNLLENYSKI